VVNCKKIQHNYSKYSKAKPNTKRKPNISTVKYLEFNSLNYVYLHKMYYDKFELGGTYEGSIETKECKQKVPSEKW
jgi:hypothetical protein